MKSSRHSLRVESFEERAVPATLISFADPSTGQPVALMTRDGADLNIRPGSYLAMLNLHRHELRLVSGYDGFRAAPGDFPVVVRVVTWNGGWNTNVGRLPAASNTSEPQAPESRIDQSAESGRGGDTSPSTKSTASSGQKSSTASEGVSIPDGSIANGQAMEASRNHDTVRASARTELPPTIPAAFESRLNSTHRIVLVASELDLLAVDGAATPGASQSDEPPVVDDVRDAGPMPAPMVEQSPALVIANDPLLGALPFNLGVLEQSVRGVLDRVSELTAAWPESTTSTEDYLWLGAAALVAGGVMQAAWTRRSRPTDLRTLGFDSVLARWGDRNVV